CQQGDSNPWTF
nr:immunoglobulin light chain junction region [Macaca mulatta]MOW12795.1 immunoglobulin light chain junction region [Macaca mulatta]MOW14078.1 immunoglobulin light chain junction region [Macaca mulatta]